MDITCTCIYLYPAHVHVPPSPPHRAEGILNRGNVDAFSLEESQNLSIFFATNNSVTSHLKKQLEEVRERGGGGGGKAVG